MHGHDGDGSCFPPHKSHAWYLMVGRPPTSSIQWIRTWKWRNHTSTILMVKWEDFFLLVFFLSSSVCLHCLSGLLHTAPTNSFTRLVSSFLLLFSPQQTEERGWLRGNGVCEGGGEDVNTTWPGDRQTSQDVRVMRSGVVTVWVSNWVGTTCWFFYFIITWSNGDTHTHTPPQLLSHETTGTTTERERNKPDRVPEPSASDLQSCCCCCCVLLEKLKSSSPDYHELL